MDRKTLYTFIQRIVRSASPRKADLSLLQLETLLREQGDDASADLVDMSRNAMPEVAREEALSEQAIRNCKKRADIRRERERMMRAQGRC